MKSFLVIASLLIVASIACTANTSVGSQPVAKATSEPQPNAQVSSTASQEKQPCTLKFAGAPVVSGLRLGMTADELLALFPGSKDDTEITASVRGVTSFGTATVVIRPDRYQSKEKFPGISQITVRLADGRVYEFTVNYNGPAYSHVDKFVAKFVEGTALPPTDQWDVYVGMDNQMKTLTCAEFEVRAFAGGQDGNLNYVVVKDLVADQKLKDRRAKARAQASPTP